MAKFPLTFEAFTDMSPGMQNTWEGKADDLPPIPCAIPPEFGGPGKGYSPEDLFGLSILNCVLATFKVYAEKAEVNYQVAKGKVSLKMDKHPQENHLCITMVDLHVRVEGASDQEKARKILDQSVKECAIGNSIKSGKNFHLEVA